MAPGDLIAAKYRLRRRLGDGAMGVVWAAVNEATRREVAIKLLRTQSPQLRSRMLQEARACGSLVHRNIVEMYDVGETAEGEPFLVMALLHGETLAARLARVGRLPPRRAAAIAYAVTRALRAAHGAGIIHRDLKPENVFLHREPDHPEEVVKILDFGVSKVKASEDAVNTVDGTLLGSPAYISPEQAQGSRGVDHRADLWSVGVILFEMISGQRPFPSRAAFAVIAELLTAPIPSLAPLLSPADRGLAAVVDRCLQRDPARRMASADELSAALSPFLEDRVSSRDAAPLIGREGDEDQLPTNVIDLRQLVPPAAPPARPAPSSGDSHAGPLAAPPSTKVSSPTTPLVGQPPAPEAPPPQRSSHRTLILAFSAATAMVLLVLLGVGLERARNAKREERRGPPVVASSAPSTPSAPESPPPQAPVTSGSAPVPSAEKDVEPPPTDAVPTSSAPVSMMGVLNINSIPVSRVILDGRPLGSTPKVNLRVAAGTHKVLFVHPTLGRAEVMVNVKPGTAALASVKLGGEVKPGGARPEPDAE